MRAETKTRVPLWRAVGVHWHGYRLPGFASAAPGQADRARRLAVPPTVLLCTPHAVSGWIVRQLPQRPVYLSMWAPDLARWVPIGDARDQARARLEILLQAARGESVYVTGSACGDSVTVYGEIVTSTECAETTGFTETLAGHYRSQVPSNLEQRSR